MRFSYKATYTVIIWLSSKTSEHRGLIKVALRITFGQTFGHLRIRKFFCIFSKINIRTTFGQTFGHLRILGRFNNICKILETMPNGRLNIFWVIWKRHLEHNSNFIPWPFVRIFMTFCWTISENMSTEKALKYWKFKPEITQRCRKLPEGLLEACRKHASSKGDINAYEKKYCNVGSCRVARSLSEA